jgi:hypothetical protein
MSDDTFNNGITREEGLERWRYRVRNHMSAKKVAVPLYPEALKKMIANAGIDQIVDEILDDPRTKDEVVPEWVDRELIAAAVESLLWDPVLTSE